MFKFFLFAFFLSIYAGASVFPDTISFQNIQNANKTNFEFKKTNKTTILFFWASWCPRCKEILPDILSIQSSNNNVDVIGISIDEDKKNAVLAAAKAYRSISRQYWVGHQFLEDLSIKMIPVIVLIDRAGKVDTVYVGSYSDKISYFKKRVQYLSDRGK